MTAVFTVAIHCDPKIHRDCKGQTTITQTTAKRARQEAAAAGWEVMRGNQGQDVCPPCRIAQIQQAVTASEAQAKNYPESRHKG